MQRLCDLCSNPPGFKCPECQSEMVEPVTASTWWPAVMVGTRSIVTGNGSTPLPPDFMYV